MASNVPSGEGGIPPRPVPLARAGPRARGYCSPTWVKEVVV